MSRAPQHGDVLAIVGAGTIATGLALASAEKGYPVRVHARSPESAERAWATIDRLAQKLELVSALELIDVTSAADGLEHSTMVVEAVSEDEDVKATVLAVVAARLRADAVLATTTSSLTVQALAAAAGCSDRFVGLHVFHPVTRMELIELIFPAEASSHTRARAYDLCARLGKRPVEVKDHPGFVVNRLLFPYLFDAVRVMEQHDLAPAELDECMTLGAGHPMGPLALLDFVGLDVAAAIGASLGLDVPVRIQALVGEGALGRKSKRGLYDYS